MSKDEHRTLLVRRLTSVDDHKLSVASQVVIERLKRSIDWGAVRRVHAYTAAAKWREIDVSKFIHWLMDLEPEIIITTSTADRDTQLPNDTFDVIIIPMLGFDRQCRRLGRGAGWYDRLLAQQPQAMKIGLGLDVQRLDSVSTEAHDIPLDMIITEKDIYQR